MQSIRRSSRRLAWLALVAMAFAVVAGMLHVTHAMAANAPAAFDPHVHCHDAHAPQQPRGHGEHPTEQVHCPACALAKIAALAPPPLAPATTAPVAVVAVRTAAAHQPAHASRHEIAARPRAPPRSPKTPSRDGDT